MVERVMALLEMVARVVVPLVVRHQKELVLLGREMMDKRETGKVLDMRRVEVVEKQLLAQMAAMENQIL
jgi:hypothetical protein